VAYRLALPLSWGIHDVFHTSLLLPYQETTVHGPNFTRPPPDLIEDEEEYEVEAIINHRRHGCRRQLQYLIKWKGYPSSDNMWEAVEDVHAEDLVKGYHKRHPLEPSQGKTGQGTRELIRALRPFIIAPSLPQEITSWLLHDTTSPIKPSPKNPPTLKSSSNRQSASIGHLRLSSIIQSMNMPCDIPTSVTTNTASITPHPEPWLTRRPWNATPPTSRPQMTRSRAALTPQLPTTPDILTSIPPLRRLSTPHKECPSPPKPLLPPNSFCWTAHPGPTTTRALSPAPGTGLGCTQWTGVSSGNRPKV